ncbi:DsbA family protein [Marinomonas sp. M1K-6]|uniref:DsbA family protein n=1 Tax=Marinomonas profundi TaxID=2726122 RepID=A0A847QXF3_9GAMM|nr:DsbA family protein [Marinomonas profundi]NLQ18338.1 DsbA family protein [Marinomonas profundi]UDV02401.1 DsbA family protein [Marinomonas profundi]
MTKIHYFFDPMCGWCYGASPLIEVLANTPEFELIYHPGGMIPKRAIDTSFRQHILQADKKIAAMTNVLFGESYKARVMAADEFVVDSYATTRAIFVGQEMGIEAHKMLAAIQIAHYQQGEHLEKLDVLAKLAVSMGLDETIWNEKMANSEPNMLKQVQQSHQLMEKMQVRGYPTLVVEKDGKLQHLSHGHYYGKTLEWKHYLTAFI